MSLYRKIYEGIIMPDKLNLPDKDDVMLVVFDNASKLRKAIKARKDNFINDAKLESILYTIKSDTIDKLNKMFVNIHPNIKNVIFSFHPTKKMSDSLTHGKIKTQHHPIEKIIKMTLGKDLLYSPYSKDNTMFDKFWNGIKLTLDHEIIHDAQNVKAGRLLPGTKNIEEWKKYFSNEREIGAFAYQAAKTFYDAIGNRAFALLKNYDNTVKYSENFDNPYFKRYADYFGPNDKVMKKFLKYIYMYLVKFKEQTDENI